MLNACLLFRDIIIIFPGRRGLVRSAGADPGCRDPLEKCWARAGTGKGGAKWSSPAAAPSSARLALAQHCSAGFAVSTGGCWAPPGAGLQTWVLETAPAPGGRRVILPSPRACPRTPTRPPALPRASALPCQEEVVPPASPLLPLSPQFYM